MKKLLLFFLSALIIPLLLTGCFCEHEWIAADCANPQSCAKCEKIGDPALGHEWTGATCTAPETCSRCFATQGSPLDHIWSDATCVAPQTCSRCSKTQGEVLAHSYGEWVFGEEDMTHTCTVCAFTETEEIDHELYLEHILTGYWNMYATYSYSYETMFQAHDLIVHRPKNNCAIRFGPDRSCQMTLGLINIDTYDTTWSYEKAVKSDDLTLYIISVPYDGSKFYFNVLCYDNGINLIVCEISNAEFYFVNYIGQHVAGNWGVAAEESGSYAAWFQFNADRTVTGYVEGNIEGIWYPQHSDIEDLTGILIEYQKDGTTAYLLGTLNEATDEFYLSDYDMTFQKIDSAESSTSQNAS